MKSAQERYLYTTIPNKVQVQNQQRNALSPINGTEDQCTIAWSPRWWDILSCHMCKHFVCTFFVCDYLTGGLFAGSLAIMTDAAHMLSDFAAFLISLFAIWVAQWLPDKKRTFGYYRAGN